MGTRQLLLPFVLLLGGLAGGLAGQVSSRARLLVWPPLPGGYLLALLHTVSHCRRPLLLQVREQRAGQSGGGAGPPPPADVAAGRGPPPFRSQDTLRTGKG